jgi:hypothetical protein
MLHLPRPTKLALLLGFSLLFIALFKLNNGFDNYVSPSWWITFMVAIGLGIFTIYVIAFLSTRIH